MGKILSACVTEDIIQMAKLHGLLPENHFGCHPGRAMTDSLHYVTKFMKDAWWKGEVVSALFLDIQSAFPSVVLSQLVHDMRQRGIPEQYTQGIERKVMGRHTTMVFNGYRSSMQDLLRGLDQVCPLLGIAFQFYNADLLEVRDTESGDQDGNE